MPLRDGRAQDGAHLDEGEAMKAVAIGFNLDTEESNHALFEGEDAIEQAHAFIESIRDDWPNRVWTVAADEEAERAHSRLLLLAIGIDPDDDA